jgi:hypothetical protein
MDWDDRSKDSQRYTCVVIDEPSKHFPDRIEIELHIDPDDVSRITGFSIPL